MIRYHTVTRLSFRSAQDLNPNHLFSWHRAGSLGQQSRMALFIFRNRVIPTRAPEQQRAPIRNVVYCCQRCSVIWCWNHREKREQKRVGKANLNFPTRQAGGQPQPTVVVGVRTSEVNAENSPLQCISSGRARRLANVCGVQPHKRLCCCCWIQWCV